jgi:hypothetical protein
MLYNIVSDKQFGDCFEAVKISYTNAQYTPVLAGGKTRKSIPFPFVEGRYDRFFLNPQNLGHKCHFQNVVAATARLIDYFSSPENIKATFTKQNTKSLSLYLTNLPEGLKPKYIQSGFVDNTYLEFFRFNKPNLRTFRLMLASYYHDIGKTAVNRRHATEGYVILSNDSTINFHHFDKIYRTYKAINWRFALDDIHLISMFVNFHDIFGTFSTGETGYIRACDMIDRIKRYSMVMSDITTQLRWSYQHLFDLWVLNVADIIVSMENKGKDQPEWKRRNRAFAKIKAFFNTAPSSGIKMPSKGQILIHDLILCCSLLQFQNQHHHAADIQKLIEKSAYYAKRHVVERIRRLILETIGTTADEQLGLDECEPGDAPCRFSTPKGHINGQICSEYTKNDIIAACSIQRSAYLQTLLSEQKNKYLADRSRVQQKKDYDAYHKTREVLKFIQNAMTEADMNHAIIRSIYTRQALHDFYNDMSWIGHMDYSLGFFKKILKRAIFKVNMEINKYSCQKHTGWIRNTMDDIQAHKKKKVKIQATFFLCNYTIIVVQILSYLLSRDSPLNRMKNIEFADAEQRLKENINLIDKIIGLEGPYRAARSQQLALEIVTMF